TLNKPLEELLEVLFLFWQGELPRDLDLELLDVQLDVQLDMKLNIELDMELDVKLGIE
ncbi:38946_t:CDS:1, partial [Gigaspora margarita]